MPRVDVLQLSRVDGVPEFHPAYHTFGVPFPVHGFVIHHVDGAIVVDTGIGYGNDSSTRSTPTTRCRSSTS